jgi:hypothetical protein
VRQREEDMNANELADEVEMWGEDLLALNMRGGIPVIEGAKMLRQQQEQINNLKQWEKRQLDVIEALKAENKQLTEWLTKVGFVK